MKKFLFILILLSLIFSCAKVGRPTGGKKDIEPPKLLFSTPKNKNINFKKDEIILHFNEYIMLRNINKNLLITPPLKQMPNISPSASAAKEIRIKFLDTLQKNTTYLINFGESIVDFNEGNKFGNFQFIFSTGNKIDSSSLKGKINFTHFNKNPKKVLIGLYETNNFYDSIIYIKAPYYIARADKNGYFSFQFLKPGKYKIIAIADENNNYVYNPKNEAIGFVKNTIEISKDSIVKIDLFKEKHKFNFDKIKQLSKNHIRIYIDGDKDSLTIKSNTSDTLIIYKHKFIDFWYKSNKDSINIQLLKKKFNKKYKSKRAENIDSLIIKTNKTDKLSPIDTLKITGNIPIIHINKKLISLYHKEQQINYKLIKNKKQNWEIDFDKTLEGKYNLQILPQAIIDFKGNKNKDTINVNFNIIPTSELGNLILEIENPDKPYFIELSDKQNKIIRISQTTQKNKIKFSYLKPGNYFIHIIIDNNNNNKWDTGNYLKHIQPEQVIYIKQPIEIRANWDINQKINP